MTFKNAALAIVATCLFANCGIGAAAEDAQKAAARRLQQMQQNMSRLQAEKSALEKEKGDLAAGVEAKAKQAAGAKAEASRLRKRVAELENELEPLRKQHEELKVQQGASLKSLEQCRDNVAQLNETQKQLEAERGGLGTRLAENTKLLQACDVRTQKLHAFSVVVIKRYEREAVEVSEPFTGLRRVEIENRAQDLRDHADELKFGTGKR